MHSTSDRLARAKVFPLNPGMPPSLLRALNTWRLRQTPPLGIEAAMLSLLTLALTVEGHLVVDQADAAPEEDAQVERLATLMRELAQR